MKCIISITSKFDLIVSLIAQRGNTSCFTLICILSNFVIQLELETVSPFFSALVLTMSCLILEVMLEYAGQTTGQIYIVYGTIDNKNIR